MTPEELLTPRFKCIGRYPHSQFIIGEIYTDRMCCEILNPDNIEGCMYVFSGSKYPAIFKPLEWWQERTIEQLKTVKFVKVIEYEGYWRVGDIVEAEFSYKDGKPYGYNLRKTQFHPIYKVVPSTKEEYETQRSNSKPLN